MDAKEMGEISLKLMKYKLEKEGTNLLNPEAVKRALGNMSKDTGIPVEKLKEYFRTIMTELVNKSFA